MDTISANVGDMMVVIGDIIIKTLDGKPATLKHGDVVVIVSRERNKHDFREPSGPTLILHSRLNVMFKLFNVYNTWWLKKVK